MKQIILFLSFFVLTNLAFGQSNFHTFGSKSAVTELHVFPNPAVDYIQVSSNDSIEQIALFNLAGRKVKTFTYGAEDKYFVGDLPKGMYLVQMVGAQNRRLATRRISVR